MLYSTFWNAKPIKIDNGPPYFIFPVVYYIGFITFNSLILNTIVEV